MAANVADALRSEIAAGRWRTVLPGYRKLQEHFGVGRPSIVAALSILTEEGVLLEGGPGKRREISGRGLTARRPQPKIEPFRKIRIVSCQAREVWPPYLIETLSNVATRLGSEWSVEDVIAHNFQSMAPIEELNKLVELNPGCLWIFLRPPERVVKWIESSTLEAICLGGVARSFKVRSLTLDWATVSVEILGALSRLGHKRISFLTLADRHTSRESEANILGDAFSQNGLEFSPGYNSPLINYFDPLVTSARISALLRHTPPTAVVCPGYKSYLSLVSACAERGLKIGEDLAVVLIGRYPAGSWLSAKPAFIEISIQELTSKLIEWAWEPDSVKKEAGFLSWNFVGVDALKPPRPVEVKKP